MYKLYIHVLFAILVNCTILSMALADDYKARKTGVAPSINGLEDDACWASVPWSVLDQIWVPAKGTPGTAADFTGHYKAVWNEDKLFILMRITDDTLINWHPNDPLNNYWNNDCPEIFIGENRSKGDHQCNYNAFAYHISTLFQAIDSDPTCNAQLFNDVITGQRTRTGNTYYWEFALNVYTDQYKLNAASNPKASLVEGKVMGFSIAYNDSDQNQTREKMYGSQVITATDPNVSYINADYFGTMELVGAPTATDDQQPEKVFSIFPNPGSEKLHIEFAEDSYDQLLLTTASGISKVMMNIKGKNNVDLDVQALPSGIYFVQLSGKNKSRTEKIIIQ